MGTTKVGPPQKADAVESSVHAAENGEYDADDGEDADDHGHRDRQATTSVPRRIDTHADADEDHGRVERDAQGE